jgi:hypothetical protein
VLGGADDLPGHPSYDSPKLQTVTAIFHIVDSTDPSASQVYFLQFTGDKKPVVYNDERLFFGFVVGPFLVWAVSIIGAVIIGDFVGALGQCRQEFAIFLLLAVGIFPSSVISVIQVGTNEDADQHAGKNAENGPNGAGSLHDKFPRWLKRSHSRPVDPDFVVGEHGVLEVRDDAVSSNAWIHSSPAVFISAPGGSSVFH